MTHLQTTAIDDLHDCLRRLVTKEGIPLLDEPGAEAFVNGTDDGDTAQVLFFAGDPTRRSESKDVAVILPLLVEAFQGRFEAALVDPAAEKALMARFGVLNQPTLAFFREGGFLGVIPRVRDWADYLKDISKLLNAPVQPLAPAEAS